MKETATELVFILDKSGSMSGLEDDTIGGFNAMLKKQQAIEGGCLVTTVLFDDGYELLHDRIDIQAVKPMTQEEYCVGGCTALLDAIGKTVNKIAKVQRQIAEDTAKEKVMFVIITDGMENASREFSAKRVKQMIGKQQERHGWEFIFLAANIDAVETAGRYGIRADRAQNYHADDEGTEVVYAAVGAAMAGYRSCAGLSPSWNAEIDRDFLGREAKQRK